MTTSEQTHEKAKNLRQPRYFGLVIQPHPELMGLLMGTKTKRPAGRMFIDSLAEQAGFEPAEGFTPRTLSRRVT